MVSEQEGGTSSTCPAGSVTTPSASHRLQHVLNSDLVKDGVSSTDHCSDVVRAEIQQLSTVMPTMWIGDQTGWSVSSLAVQLSFENEFVILWPFLLNSDGACVTYVPCQTVVILLTL